MKVCLYLSLLSAASALSKKQSPHSETGAITLESTQHGSEGESDAVSGKIPPAIGDTDKPGETAGTSMAQLAEAFHHPTGENGAAATFLTTDEGSDSSSKNDQISGKIGGATGTAMIELAEGHHEDAALDIDSSHGGDNSLLDVEGVTGDVGAVTGSSFLETMATALNPSFWHGHIFGPLSSTASGPSPATSLVAFGSRHGGSSFATSGGGTRSTSGGGTRAMGGLGGTSAHGAGAGAMGGLGGMGGGFSPSPSPFWGSGSTGDAGSAPHPHGVGTRVHGGAAVDPAVHAAAAGAYAAHAGAAAGDLPPPPPPPSFPDMSSASLEVEAHVGALQLRAHSDHAATHDSSTGSPSTHFWDAGE